jgi:hypothetical protein
MRWFPANSGLATLGGHFSKGLRFWLAPVSARQVGRAAVVYALSAIVVVAVIALASMLLENGMLGWVVLTCLIAGGAACAVAVPSARLSIFGSVIYSLLLTAICVTHSRMTDHPVGYVIDMQIAVLGLVFAHAIVSSMVASLARQLAFPAPVGHPRLPPPGLCAYCGYDLSGTIGKRCPECGRFSEVLNQMAGGEKGTAE